MHLSIFISIIIIINTSLVTGKLEKRKQTSYCIFTQEKFSDFFDFSKLANKTTDYKIQHENNDFLTLQICKPLKTPCNGLSGYAICHSKHGKEYGVGKEPPEVIVKFGETIFRYTGDKCDNKHNYTVNMKMICDFSDKKSDDILLFPIEYKGCDYNIEWRTSHACADRQQIKCTLDHQSGHYDLSPLINYSDNYKVEINRTYTVVLNVCHSVLYRPNSCKSDNAACLVTKGNQDTRNLGTLDDSLVYHEQDKTLTMTYKDGAMCTFQNAFTEHIQTTITFICDENAIKTLPKYMGGMEDCHYQFKWITAAACSEQVLEKKSLQEPNRSICSVKNPVTNFLYNFSSLMNREISVHPFGVDTQVYEFNICGPVLVTSCAKGTGACKIHGGISGGIGNSNLLWKETGPYLNYTDGSPCQTRNQKMYTIIEFYCDNIEDYEIDERHELCHDIIKMSTELACLEAPKSCITAKNEVDLNPLVLRKTNYVTSFEDSEFHINICRSLVKEEGATCPDEAAICKLTNKNGKLINPISLGTSNKNPTRSSELSAILIYNDGSICEENRKKKLESSVSFLCDITKEIGTPVFTHYKNCIYFFEWKTVLACGKRNGKLDKEACLISNSLGDVQSLSYLNQVMSPQFTANSSKSYNVSLCGFTECNGGFICAEKVIYGTNVNIVFDYSVNLIQINFTQGTQCNDGSKARSSITLICDLTSSSEKLVIAREEPCNVEFIWFTSQVCVRHNNNTKKIKPQTSESNESSVLSGGQIAAIIVVIFLILTAIVYSRRQCNLIELITNSSRHCDHVRYSRVNTEEEVHLLLDASDPNVIESDSDDDLLQA